MASRGSNLSKTGQRLCSGIKSSGGSCRSFALSDENRCWVHSERRQVEVRAAQAHGGIKSRGGKLKVRLEQIIERLYGTTPDRTFRLRDDIDDPQDVVNMIVIEGTKMVGFTCGNPFECVAPLDHKSGAWKTHKINSHTMRAGALWIVAIQGGPGGWTYRGHRVSDADVDRYLTSVGVPLSPVKGPPLDD